MEEVKDAKIKQAVRENYAKIALKGGACSSPQNPCCGGPSLTEGISSKIGYSGEELETVPGGANLGLGCGNPVALASLKEGETVLDLGSGAGLDCFLAAKKVGKRGRVIGVDMTPEMIQKAKTNAERGKFSNVEFRLGEIESLPLSDGSVDVIISNCVINLSPDKRRVFSEAFRVLKPGGRLMVSDIVLKKGLPDFIRKSVEAYVGCIAGAMLKDDYLQTIKAVGFNEVEIVEETHFPMDLMANDPTAKALMENLEIPSKKLGEVAKSLLSIKVHGIKPERSG